MDKLKKRTLDKRKSLDFASLSDLFMVLSVVFLFLYVISSIYNGTINLAEKYQTEQKIKKMERKMASYQQKEIKIEGVEQILLTEAKNIIDKIKEKDRQVINKYTEIKKLIAQKDNNFRTYQDILRESVKLNTKNKIELKNQKISLKELSNENKILAEGLEQKSIIQYKQEKRIKDLTQKMEKSRKERKEYKEKYFAYKDELKAIKKIKIQNEKKLRKVSKNLEKSTHELGKYTNIAKNNYNLYLKTQQELKKKRKEINKVKNETISKMKELRRKIKDEKVNLVKLHKERKHLINEVSKFKNIAQNNYVLLQNTKNNLKEVAHNKEKQEVENKNLENKVKQILADKEQIEKTYQEKVQHNQSEIKKLKDEIGKVMAEKNRLVDRGAGIERMNKKIKYEECLSQKDQQHRSRIRKKVAKKIQEYFDKNGIKEKVNLDTGEVTLLFTQVYFDYDSSQLLPDMKAKIEKIVPVYAKSIFENDDIKKTIQTIELMGSASPSYGKKKVDPLRVDTPWTKEAMIYNLNLSYRRARSIFKHLFHNRDFSFSFQHEMLPYIELTGVAYLKTKYIKFKKRQTINEDLGYCGIYDCTPSQIVIIKFILKDNL